MVDFKWMGNIFSQSTLYFDEERKRFYRAGGFDGNLRDRAFPYFVSQRPDFYGTEYQNYFAWATFTPRILKVYQRIRSFATVPTHYAYRSIVGYKAQV